MESRRARLEALAQVVAHNYDLTVRFGDASGDEGKTVHVEDPERTLERLGGNLNDERVLRYQKGMTLIEVAHHVEGSARWAGPVALANRESPGLFQLWHALEDARCENRLAAALPGTRKNFRAFVRPALELVEQHHLMGQLPLFLQIQWAIYLEGAGHAPGLPSSDPQALRAAWFDAHVVSLVRRLAPAIGRACHAPEPREAFRAAREIYEEVRGYLSEDELAQLGEDKRLSEAAEELLQKMQERQERGEGEEETVELELGEPPEGSLGDENETIELTNEDLAALGHFAAPWFELAGHKKEVHPSAELSDERTIVIPPEGRSDEYVEIIENAGSHIKVLAWKLMQLIQERTYTRFSGGYRTGRLNAPKLWKQRLGKYRLFQRREIPERLDVCFTLLVDESGSMNRESKYIAAREATVFFAEVLDRVEVPFEVIGYSTESSEAAMAASLGHIPAFRYRHIRHSPLQHRLYKAFDESFGQVRNRLVNIYPRFNNWDEEHLLFAYRRLSQRPEREKIIIITSDGQPNGDASHLIATVGRLEKLGVKVIGVGVVDPFVEQIYPNHIVVRDLSHLTEEIVRILRRELLGGGAEARAW